MEEIFEVQEIELVELEWVKGKGRAEVGQGSVADLKSCSSTGTFFISCPCCGEEMEVKVSRKETVTIATILKHPMQVNPRVGQEKPILASVLNPSQVQNGGDRGRFESRDQ